jgi:hypothetical protein
VFKVCASTVPDSAERDIEEYAMHAPMYMVPFSLSLPLPLKLVHTCVGDADRGGLDDGAVQVTEIADYCQYDLAADDVMLLDPGTHREAQRERERGG